MGSYYVSERRLLAGYDVFLNMLFRVEPSNPPHELDFPYHLQYFPCFGDLDPALNPPQEERRGIVIDGHSARAAAPEDLALIAARWEIVKAGGAIRNHVAKMSSAKYYGRVGGGPRMGNSIPEAISCGCLYLGNADEMNNRDVFTEVTNVTSWQGLERTMAALDDDNDAFLRELTHQREAMRYLAFSRPMSELIQRWRQKTQ